MQIYNLLIFNGFILVVVFLIRRVKNSSYFYQQEFINCKLIFATNAMKNNAFIE